MSLVIDEVLRNELHGMIMRASGEELFGALHSPSSPLRDQFLRFLASSYADWVSTQREADTVRVREEWRNALDTAGATTALGAGDNRHISQPSPYDEILAYESDGPDYDTASEVSMGSAGGGHGLKEKEPLADFLPLSDREAPYVPRSTRLSVETASGVAGAVSPRGGESSDSSKFQYDLLTSDQKTVLKAKLPALVDISLVETRNETFITKLKLCSVNFDFNTDNVWQAKGIEKKRVMLQEILEYIAKYHWYSEPILHQCIRTIARNLFRALPKRKKGSALGGDGSAGGADGDDGFEDPAWVHLQLIYDLTLRLVICGEIDKKIMRRFLEGRFIAGIIELFASEDAREREYLKTILHRIYGRFMPLRQVIRQSIAHSAYRSIYDSSASVNGIAEFLEIFCSIIHGFSVPVKAEHKSFLSTVLIPLHKCGKLEKFHEQLVACCVQFVFKDQAVAPLVLCGLMKYWPIQNPGKEEMFIAEIVNVIKALVNHKHGFDYEESADIVDVVVDRLVECMLSPHHSVAERALVVWSEEAIEMLVDMDKGVLWPKIIRGFVLNKSHWNQSLREYNEGAMDGFRVRDHLTFDTILAELESRPLMSLRQESSSTKVGRRKHYYDRLKAGTASPIKKKGRSAA